MRNAMGRRGSPTRVPVCLEEFPNNRRKTSLYAGVEALRAMRSPTSRVL